MPTGYTYNIKDGITFEQYALQCARAFYALLSMKDEQDDMPIPEEFKESDYHKKEIDKIKEKLKMVKESSSGEIQIFIDDEYNESILQNQKYIKEAKDLQEKYDKMLIEIQSWNPPTKDHEDLKKFMIQQIVISYSECDYRYYENKNIIKLSVDQYRYNKEKELLEDIDYYMKKWKEETERIQMSNKWIRDLKKSLKDKENV